MLNKVVSLVVIRYRLLLLVVIEVKAMVLMLSYRNILREMNVITRDDVRIRRVSDILNKAVSQVVLWYMLPSLAMIGAITIVPMLNWRGNPSWTDIRHEVVNLVIGVRIL